VTVAVVFAVLLGGGHQPFRAESIARASWGWRASRATPPARGNGPSSGTTPLAMLTLRFRGGNPPLNRLANSLFNLGIIKRTREMLRN